MRNRLSGILRQPRVIVWSAYATVLVAFFLRALRLADKNIWWDEGWSIWLSKQDWAAIALRTASDEHPPLHYWMLHIWNTVAGPDVFSGRFLSVAFGVLTVALVYRLGKRTGGGWVGVLAAGVLATARFHIWWSQDIKNYTPSILFAFAAVWFALDILAGPTLTPRDATGLTARNRVLRLAKRGELAQGIRVRAVLGYALCAALALWTHYLAALVLLALNLFALAVLTREFSLARLRNWLVANALAALLFVPWMAVYLQNAAAWSAAPAFDAGVFLKLVATVLPLGVTTNIDGYAVLTIVFTLIAAVGIASGVNAAYLANRKTSPGARVHFAGLYALIVVLPPILIYVLSLTPVAFFAPKVQARYLLILLPAYALLVALGVAALRRFSIYAALGAAAFILVSSAFVLNDYYASRRLTDEYATLANTVNAFREPDDVILLDTDQEWPTVLYYLRGAPDWVGVPNGAPMTAANADLLVQRARARHSAVWVVANPDALATDPQRLVEARLARDLPGQFEQTFGDKRLALYAPAPRDLLSVPPENLKPQYARAERAGESLRLLGFDLPVHEAQPGDVLHLVTYWNALTPGTASINGAPVPVPAGERIRVLTELAVPPDANGDFAVRLGSAELARVHVVPRSGFAAAGSIAQPVDYRLADSIQLTGYDLPRTELPAGDSLLLTLYWTTTGGVSKSYVVFVHLLGTEFNPAQNNLLWGQVDRVPRAGTYPTNAWLPNTLVPDPYRIPIDPHAPPGRYQIEIGLYDPATGARLPVQGGGDSILLAGVDIR